MNAEYFDLLRRLSQPIRAAALPHTLDHVHRLLDALGNPQTRFPAVVVAGSTGKGTTCLRLAHYLGITGHKVGLYTSPHLHSFRERFAIINPPDERAVPTTNPLWAYGGAPSFAPSILNIPQSEFVEHARAVLAAEETLDSRYSTFESATALALLWFAQQQVDIAVLEIGIGGRFDAVNAVANTLAIFTPIEDEHVAMLGGSIESVAWHKAGIIQPNSKAITAPQSREVMAVLEREAAEKSASLITSVDMLEAIKSLSDPFSGSPLFASWGFKPPAEQTSALRSLPGRLETITINSHPVIIDGGHTPAAARHLRQSIDDPTSVRFIVGMLRDKNVAAYLATFDAPNVHFVYTQAPGDRALTSAEMMKRFRPEHGSVSLADSLNEALAATESAPESLIVVAGSLRMAAAAREAFGLLTPDELEEARLTRAIFEGDEYQKKLKSSD